MDEITNDTLRTEAGHGLYCFGSGRGLRSFAFCLQKERLLFCVLAVVDNDRMRWGTEAIVEGRNLLVISPLELRKRIARGDGKGIIITCMAEDEIRVQLASYPELAGVSIGYYQTILDDWFGEQAEHMTFSNGLRSTGEPLIPKIIHYCWFGGASIPEEFQRYIDGWHRMCPEYEIRRWDETNYDVAKHPYMKAAYEAGKWAFVSDYARLDIVCQYGGFYFDTDVEIVRNLEELRYNEAFMAMDSSHRVSSGLGIGSVPHQPVMEELRDAYDSYEFEDFHGQEERQAKNILVCPELQSRVLERYGFIRDCLRMQDIRGVRIYPVPVLCGQIGNRRIVTEQTYSVHHYAGTWTSQG